MRRPEGVVVRFDDQTWEKYCQKVIKTDDWKSFATSKRWFSRLEINSNQDNIPESTLKQCDHWMPRYLIFTWKTPDELIEEAMLDDEIAESTLKKFSNWLKSNGVAANSAHIAAHGYIRGFYGHNKINTQKWNNPKYPPSKVKQTDGEYPLWLIEKKNGKMSVKLNRPLLQDFLARLNPRDQIIYLAAVDCGNDISFVLNLTVGFVRNSDSSSKRLFKSDTRTKTNEYLGTFFGIQSAPRMRRYVAIHRKDADDDEPLFVTDMSERKRQFHAKFGRSYTPSDPESLPPAVKLTTAKYSENCRNATVNMGIQLKKGQQSPFRPKRARHIHNQGCDFAKIPDGIKRIMEGRSPAIDGDYKSREELEFFMEVLEPYIQILTEPQDEITQVKLSQMEIKSKMEQDIEEIRQEQRRITKSQLKEKEQANIREQKLLDEIARLKQNKK